MIRFFYSENPESLTDDEFAKRQSELMWLSKMEIIPIKIE